MVGSEIIEQTNDFDLVTGISVHEPQKNIRVYQIRNKSTGVIEIETSVMASAIMALHRTQKELEAAVSGKLEEDSGISIIELMDGSDMIPN